MDIKVVLKPQFIVAMGAQIAVLCIAQPFADVILDKMNL